VRCDHTGAELLRKHTQERGRPLQTSTPVQHWNALGQKITHMPRRVGLCIGCCKKFPAVDAAGADKLQQAGQTFRALRFDLEFDTGHVSPAAAMSRCTADLRTKDPLRCASPVTAARPSGSMSAARYGRTRKTATPGKGPSSCSKPRKVEKVQRISRHRHTVAGMITILSGLVSLVSFR
jgi:hypothetical protein